MSTHTHNVCPECGGKGTQKTCHTCYTAYRLDYERRTAVPCPSCQKPMRPDSTMCRECFRGNVGFTTKGKGAWTSRRIIETKARKAKSIDFLSDSNGRVTSRQSIVRCFYHRIARKNILAWNQKQARDYVRDQGWALDEIIHSRCTVAQVNVNLTGIDIDAIGREVAA